MKVESAERKERELRDFKEKRLINTEHAEFSLHLIKHTHTHL